jgi:hypothetical protein
VERLFTRRNSAECLPKVHPPLNAHTYALPKPPIGGALLRHSAFQAQGALAA